MFNLDVLFVVLAIAAFGCLTWGLIELIVSLIIAKFSINLYLNDKLKSVKFDFKKQIWLIHFGLIYLFTYFMFIR